MKKWFLSFTALLLGYVFLHGQTDHPELKLWYNKPAGAWEEALPLGNAKTGAMVFGGIVTERVQLNDNTLWSGYPDAGNNPHSPALLPKVRELIFAGNYDSATALYKKMQGPYSARYLPLADLWIKNKLDDAVPSSYYRDLDISNATSIVKYTINGVNYRRETFISHPDKIMIVRVTADKKAGLNFTASVTSKLKYQAASSPSPGMLILKGKAPKFVANRDYEPTQIAYDDWKGEGMNFEVQVKLIAENGSIKKSGNELIVTGADAVTIYLSEATSFNGFDKSPGLQGKDPSVEASANLKKALTKSYAQLRKAHIADYQSLFKRVQLNLGADA